MSCDKPKSGNTTIKSPGELRLGDSNRKTQRAVVPAVAQKFDQNSSVEKINLHDNNTRGASTFSALMGQLDICGLAEP